jgi:Putative beta-barrel porin-2, OmpL-like. bbp2
LFLKIFVHSATARIISNFSKNVIFSDLQQTGTAAGKPQLRLAKHRTESNRLLQLLSVIVVLAVSVFPPSVAAQTVDNRESSAAEQSAVGETAGLAEEGNFFKRLFGAYRRDWNGSNQNEPEAPRRISSAPLTSPPFPSADWNYGGSSVIGATNTTSYPLMQALYGGHAGSEWKNSGVQIYGWINPGFNISTSKNANLPEGYNIFPNRIDLDQAVVYVERVPDTVQTDHIDWGFRAGEMYGIDYHFTTAKGWLSQQLLKYHRQYGFDPLMEYVDLYIPQVADGLNIRVGRFISVPDIEAQLAVNNYTYSHSLLFSYDPFTQTGIIGTLKLNDRWLINLGLSAGNDIAPWASGAKPSLTACVAYTFNKGNDEIYPCASGINSGKYAYNNVQLFVTTWYHKFNKSWHMATETYYEYQRGVPSVSGSITPETNTNAAFCAGQERCFAGEWAAVNYLQKEFSERNYVSLRTDLLNDLKGQRTGFRTLYSEHSLTWGHWIGSTILFRPELRFERAYRAPAYDLGTKHNQLSFAGDVIFKF